MPKQKIRISNKKAQSYTFKQLAKLGFKPTKSKKALGVAKKTKIYYITDKSVVDGYVKYLHDLENQNTNGLTLDQFKSYFHDTTEVKKLKLPTSSFVDSIFYDKGLNQCYVNIKHQDKISTYRYDGVSPAKIKEVEDHQAENLDKQKSAGQAYNRYIKGQHASALVGVNNT